MRMASKANRHVRFFSYGVIPFAAVALMVFFLCTAAIGCSPNRALKDYSGQPALMAVENIRSSYADIDLKVSTEYGSPVDITNESKLSLFDVVSSTPNPGTPIDEKSYSSIELTVRLNPAAQADRRQLVQKEIEDSLKNGFTKEDWFDDGILVCFDAYQQEAILDTPAFAGANEGFESANRLYYADYCNLLNSDIITREYSSDGYLLGICRVEYAGGTEEEHAYSAARALQMIDDAERFAIDRITSLLEALEQELVKSGANQLHLEYDLGSDGLTVYVFSNYGTVTFEEELQAGLVPAREADAYAEAQKELASCIAYGTFQDVHLKYIDNATSRVYLQTSVQHVEWLPATTVNLGSTNRIPLGTKLVMSPQDDMDGPGPTEPGEKSDEAATAGTGQG